MPTALGVLAVVTAASGAMTMSGAAADTNGSTTIVSAATLAADRLVENRLAESDVAQALALRAEEAVERSEQRVRLTEALAAAEQAAADQARADAEAAAAAQAAAEAAAAAAAAEAARPKWFVPVEGYRLTSLYGPRWGKLHAGLDLAAPTGTPIRAMGDGVIVKATWSGGYGQRTIIRHADGTETWYCHQSAFEVTSGPVEAGQLIGYVGSTGNSTGPHLHLEVHPGGGDAIDPSPWIADLGLTI